MSQASATQPGSEQARELPPLFSEEVRAASGRCANSRGGQYVADNLYSPFIVIQPCIGFLKEEPL